jgi:hypothetical protein
VTTRPPTLLRAAELAPAERVTRCGRLDWPSTPAVTGSLLLKCERQQEHGPPNVVLQRLDKSRLVDLRDRSIAGAGHEESARARCVVA